jgi:cytidylate kinase
MIITIDGPTASGKSTIARLLAQELHIFYLSSGLLYRALAYVLMMKKRYDYHKLSNPSIDDIDAVFNQLYYDHDKDHKERMLYHHEDIFEYLKSAMVDQGASIVSTHAYVRNQANNFQRRVAQKRSIVVDGRDTGSVVFPDADYKFFLTAMLEIRAVRWQIFQQKKGIMYTLEQACAQVQERDERDTKRIVDPLCIPEKAVIVDSSYLSEQQICKIIRQAINQI